MAEFVVWFFVNQPIPRLFVNMTGGMEHVVGPEHDLPVACLTGEALALADQAFSDAKPTRLRIDQQQPQLRNCLRFFDEENRPDVHSVLLGNPAALPFRIEVPDEFNCDLGDQQLELFVPTVLLGIQHSVLMNDPAHISCLMWANEIRGFALWL